MDIQTLQKHVLTLAAIEETDAPMVSCYLNLEKGLAAARRILDERVRLLRQTLPAPKRDSFEQALLGIESRLAAGFETESLGAAIYSRDGDQKFFLDLEFRACQAVNRTWPDAQGVNPYIKNQSVRLFLNRLRRCAPGAVKSA